MQAQSNCLHVCCIQSCLTSVPCWAGHSPFDALRSSLHSQPWAFSPHFSSSLQSNPMVLWAQLSILRHPPPIGLAAPFPRAGAQDHALGLMLCWHCPEIRNNFWTRGSHFQLALGSTNYVTRPVGGNYLWGQLQHMTLCFYLIKVKTKLSHPQSTLCVQNNFTRITSSKPPGKPGAWGDRVPAAAVGLQAFPNWCEAFWGFPFNFCSYFPARLSL